LAGLQRLAKAGVVRRYVVIKRGGIRFGIFGLLGKEAMFYTSGGAAMFADPFRDRQEMVTILRERRKWMCYRAQPQWPDEGADGRFVDGEDVELPKAVPGIDVVIGGHSHTFLNEAIIVNGRTPVVQPG